MVVVFLFFFLYSHFSANSTSDTIHAWGQTLTTQLISVKNITVYREEALEKMFLSSANIEYLNSNDTYECSLKITDEKIPRSSSRENTRQAAIQLRPAM